MPCRKSFKIGETKVIKLKICKFLAVIGAVIFSLIKGAAAQDISAIDFEGTLIGKVMPDGTTINLKNEVIGQLTADSFVLNSDGNIVGGIIPQGFAISNDHKYLGKVNNDGTVRMPSGRIAGKVLPNGLVVDETAQIIGAVLSTGIIYSDEGKAVGRLAGNGLYINFEGRQVGFVSSTGYAYRQTESGFVLDGRLLSAKMVVSNSGQFIGSVTPGGQVSDFEGAVIGRLHANGYVYDLSGKIIGGVVQSAYAFDNNASYLGLVSYNGEIVKDGKIFGRMRADHKIVDTNNQIIGFTVDTNSVAVNLTGGYLGYLVPEGKFVKNLSTSVGKVGPRGTVLNNNGEIIGQIVKSGPVFDALGQLKAEAVANGEIFSFEGTRIGYMKGSDAFDNAGFLVGGVIKTVLVADDHQNILGITGIGSDLLINGKKYRVSPLGYLFTVDNVLSGQTISLDATYKENGKLFGYVDLNGNMEVPNSVAFRLDSNGLVLNEKNEIEAGEIAPSYAYMYNNEKPYILSQTNILTDNERKGIARIIPEYKIIRGNKFSKLLPITGYAAKDMKIVLNVKGDLIGYPDKKGDVYLSTTKVGTSKFDNIIVNDQNVFVGQTLSFKPIVNNRCESVGVVGLKGEIRNGRDSILGKLLTNGQGISEVGQNIGHLAVNGSVFDFEGKMIGTTNSFGQVLNGSKQTLGCLDNKGRLYDETGGYRGSVVQTRPVISFSNEIIGRIDLKNQFIDNKSEISGFAMPDGTVVDEDGQILGAIFAYKFAFDTENNFIGYITDEAKVFDDNNNFAGEVAYDGLVIKDGKAIGYALYDLYAYDENGYAVGYYTKNGAVVNFSGLTLGKAVRGFLVSKNGALIARGNRDYFIRDKNDKVIGELTLSGEVKGFDGEHVGTLLNNGEIRDSSAVLIAKARPLQYYDLSAQKPELPKVSETEPKPEFEPYSDQPIQDYAKKVIGVVISPNGKYIGDLLEDGTVIDETGNIIGRNKNGLVFDENGNLIGSVEDKDKKAPDDLPKMYMPAEAYGDRPSLGAGGGFGPGERYDPVRSKLLAELQKNRQEGISVGKISSNISPSSFTGTQSNWDGANYVMSSWRVDMSEMILADKPIPAVLARTIMDSGGASDVPITAIVERNVYAEDGRNIVIPAGSRIMGQASGGSSGGSSGGAVRMDITWSRLIRPDGSAFEFTDAQTGDAQGRAGALGYLDEQLLKKYTLPIATSLMSSALTYVSATGGTTTTYENGTTVSASRDQAAEQARQNFLKNMDNIFNDILKRKTEIEAVTYVPAGTRLIIYPKVDLWIRTAAREQESSFNGEATQKPEQLIDDGNPAGTNDKAKNTSGGQSSGETSSVVYNGEDNVEPAKPLIDDSAGKASGRRRSSSTGATPPPPSTSASSSTSADNSAGQLF